MGFMGGLFERKSAGTERQATSHAVSQSPSRYGIWGSSGPWDVDKAVNDAYEKDIWVYRCIDAIATNQASIPLLHRRGDARTGQLVENKKLMSLLNIRPNDYETAAQLRYRLHAQALLSRKGVFLEVVGGMADPQSLHLLPPQSVEPIPDPNTFVSGYRVRGADMSETILAPEQVIWIKLKPHPIDPYQQMTPLVAAGISVETDLLARMFNRNFLMNDGRPGLLVSVRGQMMPEDAAEIKRRFSGGPATAGQTTVIEADGMDVADLSASPRDAQWMESIGASKEDILLAFGVPESVLGNASGRTFDNADAEYEIFWTHTMKPQCEAIASALDIFTGNLRDDDRIAFDYNSVDVLQRQERRRQDAIIDRWARGVITWNEMREELGKDQWQSAVANLIVLPSGFAMLPNSEDQASIMQLPNVNTITGGANTGVNGMEEVARQGALKGSREGARSLNNILAARALQLAGKQDEVITVEQLLDEPKSGDAAPFDRGADFNIVEGIVIKSNPHDAVLTELEAKMDGLLIGMSRRQGNVVCDRLEHAKSRKGTRHWEADESKAAKPPYPYKNLDPMYAVESARWARETRDDFESVLRPILKREAARVGRDVAKNGGDASKMAQQAAMDEALDEVLAFVEKSVQNQSQRMADKIKKRDAEGASLEDIKREVRDMVSTRSSWHKGLSGHAAVSAIESLKHSLYETVEGCQKTWNTQEDERVRDSHQFVDGDTVSVKALFTVGSTMMKFPHDPVAPVEETINCRCFVSYSV